MPRPPSAEDTARPERKKERQWQSASHPSAAGLSNGHLAVRPKPGSRRIGQRDTQERAARTRPAYAVSEPGPSATWWRPRRHQVALGPGSDTAYAGRVRAA